MRKGIKRESFELSGEMNKCIDKIYEVLNIMLDMFDTKRVIYEF